MIEYELDIFSQLLRMTNCNEPPKGNGFSDVTIKNWYIARQYVLDILRQEEKQPPLNGVGFTPSENKHLHVVIDGTSDLMLCIARQISLIAHFLNFDETNGNNRTIITILYNSKQLDASTTIVERISQEEYLCNLPLLCKYSLIKWNRNGEKVIQEENPNSFIDIELELIDLCDFCAIDYINSKEFSNQSIHSNTNCLYITEKHVREKMREHGIELIKSIDIRKARRANMVYYVGADIDNLPPDDPNTAERYSRALHYFCYQQSSGDTQKKWNGFFKKDDNGIQTQCVRNQIELRNLLSNIFCTDCFESRLRSIVTIDAINDEFDKSIFSRSKRLFSWRKHRCVEKFYEFVEQDENNDADDAKWKEELKKRKKEKGLKGIKEVNRKMFDWFLQYEYRKVLHIVKANLTVLAKCEHARWNVEKLILGFSPLTDEERAIDELKFGKSREQYRKELKKDSKCPKHIDLCSYHDLQRRNPADMKYDCFLMMAMAWILKR